VTNIFEEARNRHKANVTDFGIPERYIDGSEEKIWRVRSTVVGRVARDQRYCWDALVPVMSGGTIVGMATIYPVKGDQIATSASLSFNIPERLDFENGIPLDLTPTVVKKDDALYLKQLNLVLAHGNSIHAIESDDGIL
jgi:hypothetical protein